MQMTLILTSAVVPGISDPLLIHNDSEKRINETLHKLKKWNYVASKFGIKCILVDNTLDLEQLEKLFSPKKFSNFQILSAPKVPNEKYDPALGGVGFAELLSIQHALGAINLEESDFIIKCNARYFIKNFSSLYNFVTLNNEVYYYTTRQSRAETKFFVMSRDHFKNFVAFAYKELGMAKGLHLEHILAKYITQKGFEKSVLFPVEPVISGISGRTGKSYRFFSESWAHSFIYQLYRYLR
jgi:hypothetical protein